MILKITLTLLCLSLFVVSAIGISKDTECTKFQMALTIIMMCLIPLDFIFIMLTIWLH